MESNTAGKIKLIAKIILVIEIIATVIAGIAAWELWTVSLAIIIGGFFVAYVGYIMLNGFAEIVENTQIIANRRRSTDQNNRM